MVRLIDLQSTTLTVTEKMGNPFKYFIMSMVRSMSPILTFWTTRSIEN
ncbi:hypothetical protein LOK49_LG03G01680 [Camellia lanceoleosa]|uniref:Uncharacterized protein n=1 Tax=Camellia lanceoleosa TaxID=1840588 RepID=A0ACC0ICR3_9ERIC|nr:hypothetical protein LOK49_LG03G01680 [Camellia lanceoleosa]